MVETSETTIAVAAPAESPAKKLKKSTSAGAKAKNPKTKPTHPPTSAMVDNAITQLKERGGSSLQNIKKYLSSNYKVDVEKLAPFIRKYLKSAVISGKLIQTKGKGASGSFKLAGKGKDKAEKSEKKTVAKKSIAAKPKKEKTAKAKKSASGSPKKATGAEKKKAVSAAAKSAKKAGTVKAKAAPKEKPTKASKSAPADKKKAPKPKKAGVATKKAAAKKATPKK